MARHATRTSPYELNLEGELSGLGETVNITVYRIVQECLTNVVRHAGANRAQINVRRTPEALEVVVRDNGRGLGERNANEAARFGLMGMRERVQALRGEFELATQPGDGLERAGTHPLERGWCRASRLARTEPRMRHG